MNNLSHALSQKTFYRIFYSFFLCITFLLLTFPNEGRADPSGTVDVQLLSINDFEGHLQPPSNTNVLGVGPQTPLGGVEWLSTYMSSLRATNPNTLAFSSGDLIGASPLISALFYDKPTVEAMNVLGLDFANVANNDLSRGSDILNWLAYGGCNPVTGCSDTFSGATYQYLAANVIRDVNGKTLFPAYKIRSFGGAKVAIIGVAPEATPTLITASAAQGLSFANEVATINSYIPEILAKGVNAIVVMIHAGGGQVTSAATTDRNACNLGATPTGDNARLISLVNQLDSHVDVVLDANGGPMICNIGGKLVTQAYSFGRSIVDVNLTIDRATGEVISKSASNVLVNRNTAAADPNETVLVNNYLNLSAPLANSVVGSITADITADFLSTSNGESALGDVVADAQLAASAAAPASAVVAFMNPGGMRAPLLYNQISGGEQAGQVTYGEAFSVQPFSNLVVTMTLTGAQIKALLEQQFTAAGAPREILQVSNGFTYTWDNNAPAGNKVDASSIKINGVTVDPNASYRVTMNNFLAAGGDSFSVFAHGTNLYFGSIDLDALTAYLGAHSPVAPGPKDRITRLN